MNIYMEKQYKKSNPDFYREFVQKKVQIELKSYSI